MPVFTTARQRLGGDLTLYVSPSGSDLNNGYSPTTAMLTPQRAYNSARLDFDLNGYSPVIQLAHGSYPALNCYSAGMGHHLFRFIGDPVDPTAVTISALGGPAVISQDQAVISLSGVRLVSDTMGIWCRQLAILDYDNVAFEAMPIHVRAESGQVSSIEREIILGSATIHWMASINSKFIAAYGIEVNIPTPQAFTYFMFIEQCSTFSTSGAPINFTGAACTGQKYLVQLNATAHTAGTIFPGNIAGVEAYGGYVI
jgi:hypothetical protein